MARRKEPKIPDAILDQLLGGADPKTAFDPNGLLDDLKKALAERVLNAEMDHHLANGEADNSRNGYGKKTVVTDTARIELDVPRDRQSSFDPHLIAKCQRRFPGFDEKIISMYARGMSVRDQYAGDVSDVLKFAFLRALAGTDRTLGIAWYYAPGDDGRADGRHLEWRDEAAWRLLDEELHTGLAALRERSISALEWAAIWPKGALFHREPMPSPLERSAWGVRKRAKLDGANIVFLDPDNGIGAETDKHATFTEIRLLRKPGRAIVFIAFPGRKLKHDALQRRLHERLAFEVGAETVVTLRTNVSVPRAAGSRSYVQRQRWFTIVDPDPELTARARAFATKLASVPRVRAQLSGV